jgi:hypothetical protein
MMRAAIELVHLSGRRSAKTIRACGSVAALQGRIHDCKRRIHHRQSKPFAKRGRSIHVILFEQDGADQPHDAGLVREDADDVGPPLHLLVEAFERIGAVQLGAVLGREGHVGQHIVFAVVHQRAKLGPAWPQLVGDVTPGLARGLGVGLQKGLADRRGNHRVLALRHVRQGVAHPMHAGAVEK